MTMDYRGWIILKPITKIKNGGPKMARKKKTKKKTTRKSAKKTSKKKAVKKKTAKKKKTKKKATKKKSAGKKKKTTKKKAKKVKKKASGKKKKTRKKRKPNPAFMKPLAPSSALAAVIGSKPLPRTQVIKKIWDYIKKNGLQDKTNRRNINADEKLKKVFGRNQVSMFEMARF